VAVGSCVIERGRENRNSKVRDFVTSQVRDKQGCEGTVSAVCVGQCTVCVFVFVSDCNKRSDCNTV
jgi:hypothetical protein